MADLQHHKSIAVKGLNKVVYGSTNFTWRGFYVQSNNAIVVKSKKAVDDYFEVEAPLSSTTLPSGSST